MLAPEQMLTEVSFVRDSITGDHKVTSVLSGSRSEQVRCRCGPDSHYCLAPLLQTLPDCMPVAKAYV